MLHSYTTNGRKFEIWCTNLLDPRALEILSNMRIFISFYIEGGTCNFLDDPAWTMERWKIFLVYEVLPDTEPTSPPYCLAGFGTSYRNWVCSSSEILESFYAEPPSEADLAATSFLSDKTLTETPNSSIRRDSYDPLTAPSRERISQFLILPPYQHQSHGTHLYNTMTKIFLDDPSVFEITVEDPNEAFDDLRDYCDLARLTPDPKFSSLRLPDKLPPKLLEKSAKIPHADLVDPDLSRQVRHKYKIAPRQFNRLLEIQLLSTIAPRHRSTSRITRKAQSLDPQDRQYYFWRLLVKTRLLWQNKDTLIQLDAEERVPKLEETLQGLQEEYERLLKGFERRKADGLASLGAERSQNGATAGASSGLQVRKKRKVVDDDEDDVEDGADDGSRTPLKKVKA
jgi:histone acetyltransferase 1